MALVVDIEWRSRGGGGKTKYSAVQNATWTISPPVSGSSTAITGASTKEGHPLIFLIKIEVVEWRSLVVMR